MATNYKAKEEMHEIDDPDFHICDAEGCLNSYTPYRAPGGNRYCLTHAKK